MMERVTGRTDAAILFQAMRFVDGTKYMQPQWILSSTSLPRSDRPVYFLLKERDVPMHGTFANGVFHAHWADYCVERVESWCADEVTAQPIERQKVTMAGRFLRALKQWSHKPEDFASVHAVRKERT
jgi:hypothetical protein